MAHGKMIAARDRVRLIDKDPRVIPIGAQVPMAGGALRALEYALETGCETMQIFAKSPRRWAGPPRDAEAAEAFREACAQSGMGPVFSHAGYLINMGSEDAFLWERSSAALADELARGAGLGVAGVVVHLGRRFSDDDAACIDRVRRCVVHAAEMAGESAARILLENSAGAGRQFGVDAAQMAGALNAVRAAGVDAALCLDTCHAYAAGTDLRTGEGWTRLLGELTAECGRGAVALVHANDCKGGLGAHKDRHEWIGDGEMGRAAFGALFLQPELEGACVVVEMPGEGPYKDTENVSRLKALRDGGAGNAGPARARA
jgi:deoxyribonuclease IV